MADFKDEEGLLLESKGVTPDIVIGEEAIENAFMEQSIKHILNHSSQ